MVEETLSILEAKYFTDISLAEIAEQLGINESYLSKVYKENTGKNFKEHLTELKINKSKQLLLETNLPIMEISCMVGYNNYKQFMRIFKQIEGITATDYRNYINKA